MRKFIRNLCCQSCSFKIHEHAYFDLFRVYINFKAEKKKNSNKTMCPKGHIK